MRTYHPSLPVLLCSLVLAACVLEAEEGPAAGSPAASETRQEERQARADGIEVSVQGAVVRFRIPLAHTVEPERSALFALMLQRFREGMEQLRTRLSAELGDESPLLAPLALYGKYEEASAPLIRAILDSVGTQVTDVAAAGPAPPSMPHWKRYVVPQAYLAFVGGAVTFGMGISGGPSVMLVVVAQPWLEVAVDRISGRELSRGAVVDVELLGVPGLEAGLGSAGGAALQVGAGVVWGPLASPRDLTGLALGVAACGSIPLIAGGRAALLSTLRSPPLIYAMAGHNGAAAKLDFLVHPTGQLLLDIDEFVEYVKGAL
jgi:hypothetical protein